LLRFEADGYASYVSRLIAPNEGSVRLQVTLHPVSMRTFSVLNPDGSPAAWADVGFPERTKGNYSLAIMPGGLERYGEDGTGPLQQTDVRGVIKLPADGEIHRVVAANRAGYLETNLDAVADGGSIQLQPWGSLEGSLPEPEKSRANQEVWISNIGRPGSGLMAGTSFNVKPDVTGHFVLPRVPPWRLAVSVGTKRTTSAGQWSLGSSRMAQVEVRPGETTEVTFEQQPDTANR
jgi:hypothetical protein